MSEGSERERAREVASALSRRVTQALDESTVSRSMDGAREMARSHALAGLDQLLATLARYAPGPWPAPLRPVIERLQRAAAECAREGGLEPFRGMDGELGLMARAIERVALDRPAVEAPARAEPATAESDAVPLAEALDGVPGERDDSASLRRVRLRAPVAGALRAALEWLVGGSTTRRRMWLSSDGSALDVICEGISFTGVHAAAEVLASVGAHLGPTGSRPGAWTVRVPIRAERETFLMLEQDELQLAVPWHAVVRVRLIPTETIDIMLSRQGLPVVAPIAVSARRGIEQPVSVVALGLKRACVVADRLVWRMSAEPAEMPGRPPAPGISRAVRSDDGEVHWVLEPEWLLRDVVAPPMARPGFRPASAPAAPGSPEGGVRDPAETPVPDAEAPARGETPAPEPLPVLGPEHVEPLDEPTRIEAEPAPTMPGGVEESRSAGTRTVSLAPSAAPESSAGPAVAPRRALVAEDSIAARIYLVRLLEQRGFDVHAVGSAAELRASLAAGPWTMICADGDLPDAGLELLGELSRSGSGPPVVALVRDEADARAARTAGVAETLRKPFTREALAALLERLLPEAPRGDDDGAEDGSPEDPGGADPRESGAR